MNQKTKHLLSLAILLLAPVGMLGAEPAAGRATPVGSARPVYVVPNFHPASCGWLTDWSTERNYCANSYFDHLDRVRDDRTYNFALSECNNLIAMLNFRPERCAELKQRIPRRARRTVQRVLPRTDDQPLRRRGAGEDGRRGLALAAAGDGRAAAD